MVLQDHALCKALGEAVGVGEAPVPQQLCGLQSQHYVKQGFSHGFSASGASICCLHQLQIITCCTAATVPQHGLKCCKLSN